MEQHWPIIQSMKDKALGGGFGSVGREHPLHANKDEAGRRGGRLSIA
jgi:hypothetical protein